ncbi:MAG: hypothetical protein L3K01_00500 [Thermoplasmata archaeon]|nr:hypothetical protein [Thermoplasmata archaeon]MCI4332204.1 hypothetical protein [Thermoplasmata archaeon]
MTAEPSTAPKKPSIVLTSGSRVRVRSAGTRDEALVSTGLFRGLVSVGGDNSLAVELDDSVKEEKGRIRLIPLNAMLALDVLEAAKPEEEKRAADSGASAYFR